MSPNQRVTMATCIQHLPVDPVGQGCVDRERTVVSGQLMPRTSMAGHVCTGVVVGTG